MTEDRVQKLRGYSRCHWSHFFENRKTSHSIFILSREVSETCFRLPLTDQKFIQSLVHILSRLKALTHFSLVFFLESKEILARKFCILLNSGPLLNKIMIVRLLKV